MPAKKPKPDEKPQSERFIETAREIGADETQEGFERVFEKIIFSPQIKTAKKYSEER
jgi:hypothetical protein